MTRSVSIIRYEIGAVAEVRFVAVAKLKWPPVWICYTIATAYQLTLIALGYVSYDWVGNETLERLLGIIHYLSSTVSRLFQHDDANCLFRLTSHRDFVS